MRRAVLVAAALLLAGCTAAPPAERPAWDGIPITHPHVLLSCPGLAPVHLDTVPHSVVEVRRCTADFHEVQGVLNKVQYVQRVTSEAEALLEAYTSPDEQPSGAPCTHPLPDPRVLWLDVGSGDVMAVRAPVDGCGHPLDEAAAAYDEAAFESILIAREVAADQPSPTRR